MGCSNCPAKELINISQINNNEIDNGCGKLDSFDWMQGLPDTPEEILIVEVQFKNTRKEFFTNKNKLSLKRNDYVAVSSANGHDVGKVTLTGKMALLQFNRKKPKTSPEKSIYRKATKADIEKWQKARLREKPVMIKARQLVEKLGLEMKISDVEFQGDGSKATFYYIAEGRVDFRELIKVYAREFNIRVDMRQIGARQEAAMVGGIGSCGKELCCSAWRTNLDSVSANAARIQELPHNIQKLTGQCGKLKCCLMYELDTYIDAQNDFPDLLLELETEQGIAYPKKRDVLKKIVWYGMSEHENTKLVPVPLQRVKDIIQLNKRGVKVSDLIDQSTSNDNDKGYQSFENDLDILKRAKKKPKKRRKYSNKSKKTNR